MEKKSAEKNSTGESSTANSSVEKCSTDRKEIRLTSLVKTSGCAAKLPPESLHRVIDNLPLQKSENLVEGFETSDDALVWKLDEKKVCVQTVDFFPPMVDDPYIFGQIAAANALSDIYAMGGEPAVAMNLLCFPSCLPLDVMEKILCGGLDKVREAGAVIAGGHTISDPTPKYGLSVTAFMDACAVWSNKGALPGDAVVLTKALGTGIINTAAKADEAPESAVRQAIRSMTTLNRKARDLACRHEIHSATDVTGFSLSGHAGEVAEASGVSIRIELAKIPVLEGATDLARLGFLPEGRYSNEVYLKDKVLFPKGADQALRDLCFDPQTSGGLLLFMPPEDAESFEREMGESSCRVIGTVVSKDDYLVEYI